MSRTSAALFGIVLLGSAATAEPGTPAEEGVCSGGAAVPLERLNLVDELQRQLEAEQPAPGGDVVALNGRGYRYAADRAPAIARDLQILEIELRRARAAARQSEPEAKP